MTGKALDLAGKKFGSLTAVSRYRGEIADRDRGHAQWLCICDCGTSYVARSTNLTNGNTSRCKRCRHDDTNFGHPFPAIALTPAQTASAADTIARVTVVDVWYTGFGEHGGFATAMDSKGRILARSRYYKRKFRTNGGAITHLLARLVCDALIDQDILRAPYQGEGHARWAKAVLIHARAHLFTPVTSMQERFEEAAAQWPVPLPTPDKWKTSKAVKALKPPVPGRTAAGKRLPRIGYVREYPADFDLSSS